MATGTVRPAGWRSQGAKLGSGAGVVGCLQFYYNNLMQDPKPFSEPVFSPLNDLTPPL